MRAIWKGAITFGLVNIPISLYPAIRREELKFRLLRKEDESPIKYQRVAENDGKEVPWQEIVKGFEYEKGKFVALDPDDFKKADVRATQTVDIVEFVPLKDIDPIFFDTPYYLEPQKSAIKAYSLLREALKRSGKVGIAKVVIKTRQHLAAIKPKGRALVLESMHFAEELVEAGSLQIPGSQEVGSKELDMALQLVARMSGSWDPEKFNDDYRHALLELIEKKVALGGRTPATGPAPKLKPTKVIDIVSVLKQSLAQAQAITASRKGTKGRNRKQSLKRAA